MCMCRLCFGGVIKTQNHVESLEFLTKIRKTTIIPILTSLQNILEPKNTTESHVILLSCILGIHEQRPDVDPLSMY